MGTYVTIEFPDNESREAASKLMYEANVKSGVKEANDYSSGAYSGTYNKLEVNLDEASGNISKIRDIAELYHGKM